MFAWLSTIVTSISAIASSLFLVVEEDELPSFASGRIEYCGNEKKSLKGCGDVRSCSGFILLGFHRECPKPSKDKNQRVFVGGSWSDSDEEDDEKVKNKTCLVAHASSE
ncbi:hypothetical protein Tco_0846697, partial [Tanacetum coccineum]